MISPSSTKVPSPNRSTRASSVARSPATGSTRAKTPSAPTRVDSVWLGAEVRARRRVVEPGTFSPRPRNSSAKTSSRGSGTGDVRGDGEPASPTPCPHVGVAAGAGGAVRPPVGRARVDDGDVAHDADVHVVRGQVLDRHRLRRLLQKRGAVDERRIGIGAHEVLRQDLVEAPDIA